MRLGTLLKRTLAPAAACALALAACGSQPRARAHSSTRPASPAPKHDHTVYLYSSLPLSGPERSTAQQLQRGIEFALRGLHGRRGGLPYRIRYRALDDAATPGGRAQRGAAARGGSGWNPSATVRNAQRAARNPQTVAFIGELDSGATMLSLPILNEAGIVQMTPGSGYPGLTDAYKNITNLNEPGIYYPQPANRTLVRLIPNDLVQASAAVTVARRAGCQRVAAWGFGNTPDAAGLVKAVAVAAQRSHEISYTPPPPLGTDTKTYVAYAHSLAVAGLHCGILVGSVTRAAVALTTDLREQLSPGNVIIGSSGFCSSRWLHGIPASLVRGVAAGLYCMTPALPVQNYINGTRFIHMFRRAYHHAPSAYDYLGYEAAQLVIRAVRDLVPGEDPRTEVASSIIGGIASVELDWYAFTGGDSSSSRYGVDTFVNGIPKHHTTVTP
ncbi:MAG: ABC transporter substrate-binding protein [Acidobacteriota bacterium]|nr:ABC transporter substrate-binding protein [Acidobacteriota bacterium]